MIHFHKWVEKDNQPKYKYMKCEKCGKRKIVVTVLGGYQPMKYPNWEKCEKYIGMPPLPNQGSSICK